MSYLWWDKIVKSLTTPSLKTNKSKLMEDDKPKINKIKTEDSHIFLNENSNNVSTILRSIKKEIEKNSTFVGNEFVCQARYERRKN